MNLPDVSFTSFKDAASYRPKCPLCATCLSINDRDLVSDDVRVLTFYVNQREDDTITLDTETDKVELIIRYRPVIDVMDDPNLWPLKKFMPTQPNYVGRFMHGLTFDCPKCCQYAYTIQIHFDLEHQTLLGIYLNSESLCIEDEDMTHEVKNSYASNQTYYSSFDKEGDSKKTSLPLIPLDLSKPKETILRIRKLLVFS